MMIIKNVEVVVVMVLATITNGAQSLKIQIPTDADEGFFLILNFESGSTTLRLETVTQTPILEGRLGLTVAEEEPNNCFINNSLSCHEWSDSTRLALFKSDRCIGLEWTTNSTDNQNFLRDCYSLKDTHWYGGGEIFTQLWPIGNIERNETPYVTENINREKDKVYGGVLESYWLSSKGVALFVADGVPLFVSINQNQSQEICFKSQHADPYRTSEPDVLHLKYQICPGSDAKDVHMWAVDNLLGKPSSIPDKTMMQYPVWSTWIRYKQPVNQSQVLQFADEIISHGFNYSNMEIDDKWESCYGEAEFESDKFPDPAAMIQSLKENGFRVTLWIHPFINFECSSFTEASELGYFVKNTSGQVGFTSWWGGDMSGVIDFTNAKAVRWWTNRLNRLRNSYGVDSFKFDAGEACWLPTNYSVYNATPEMMPNYFSTLYSNIVSSNFGNLTEVRVGRRSQKNSVFVRLMDKSSVWGYDNGLKSIITATLQFGIVGYPFSLPDMIGGDGYAAFPSKEMFLRWMAANIFLPALQFSIAPWDYDDEVIEIARNMTRLHSDYINLFLSSAEQAVQDGSPIIRPLWWLNATDTDALTIDSEFLVGDDLLVAPVLDENVVERDVYIPAGRWIRPENGEVVEGPIWLEHIPAPLSTLIYFTRVG